MCKTLFGNFCHWGPIGAFVIITWVVLSTVYCNLMWWPPEESWQAFANMLGFLSLSCLTNYHFFAALCDGPGYVELGWKPKNKKDESKLQYCQVCQGFKAPRSHHCRKCNRCVMKMDHHCPWINTCVGHFNHGHFTGFLFFAVVGSIQAGIVQAMTLYYGLNRNWYRYYGTGLEPDVTLTIFTLLTTLLGLGLSIGVIIAVGALFAFQLRSILKNQTGIEDWIIEKAKYRLKDSEEKFKNPYFLGKWKNLTQVITPGCVAKGNGIDWPLREGANEFDMTVEQILQKKDKRQRTREYKIIKSYSGSWFPLYSMGFGAACHPPYTDESRIKVQPGDIINVTRWKKHWLYGDKKLKSVKKDGDRVRGWFPRICAEDIYYQQKQQNGNVVNKKTN